MSLARDCRSAWTRCSNECRQGRRRGLRGYGLRSAAVRLSTRRLPSLLLVPTPCLSACWPVSHLLAQPVENPKTTSSPRHVCCASVLNQQVIPLAPWCPNNNPCPNLHRQTCPVGSSTPTR
ncbi:hypothetical protein GBAR_LOCUS28112 [Geodia barretti]|uniref:Uncharacterized protein n=1 Tax=Geodia barretti TaxID=519541 RepID=A0AA35TPB3_GEOBA|nr:hypothetical protein GBAR_LOCUS28112 [Geodia barretti]